MKTMKMSKIIMTGMMVAALTGGMATNIRAENIKNATSLTCADNKCMTDDLFDKEFDMVGYINGLNCLSDSEKQKLLADETKIEEKYQAIDKIRQEIDAISSRILEGSENLYTEREKIFEKNAALWDKLYEHVGEAQNFIVEMEDFIKASDSLSEEEKEVLLADEKAAKEIEAQLNLKYDEVERAIADLDKEERNIYDEIDSIDKENESLWDKVWENQSDEDSTPVLY